MFSKNIGNIDRISRVVLGAGGIAAGYLAQSYLCYAIGGALLLTALFGICPMYSVLGIRTKEVV